MRDSGSFTKTARPRGTIKFHPYEELDELSMREIAKFQVTPFGRIKECCAHIPYNSGKKDFYEKTGRESFEVFKYEFRVPGDDTEYTVMWDYNVGLVRMTPFFKCCQYGKTMPAKMLSLNPGLKDITHSITGGAISAQVLTFIRPPRWHHQFITLPELQAGHPPTSHQRARILEMTRTSVALGLAQSRVSPLRIRHISHHIFAHGKAAAAAAIALSERDRWKPIMTTGTMQAARALRVAR
ncbi:unnamed protein product [Parascedosporium putredinis]|uniref:Uncharacterized protein n=1 Tax=Parascedosporium putredinis TaxID=1442378 RepID=A0A9P1GXJ2_9PEZI|nr:unnamed protein product [Parascedosporium putredinis]CAI7990657.1 unnamed protein product [Parascedosporium putredinis]